MLLMVKTSNRVKKMLVVLMTTERCLLLILLVDNQSKSFFNVERREMGVMNGAYRYCSTVTSFNRLLHVKIGWIRVQ